MICSCQVVLFITQHLKPWCCFDTVFSVKRAEETEVAKTQNVAHCHLSCTYFGFLHVVMKLNLSEFELCSTARSGLVRSWDEASKCTLEQFESTFYQLEPPWF